mmetsp:Transcript_24439/g.37120  ORF Transcript_24439/g.37120 Transcript_24439/m.37120 type:complete len:1157 (+) Transcript_24439:210-3680(+)
MDPNQTNGAEHPETAPTESGSTSPRRTVKDAIAISLDDAAVEAEEPAFDSMTSGGTQEPPEALVRPGAVSVSSAAPRGKRRPTSAVPSPNGGDSAPDGSTEESEPTVAPGSRSTRPSRRADAKTALREEMETLRKTNGPSQPGAVSVSSGSTSARTTTVNDPKASIKREMDALRSAGPSQPGAVSVSSKSTSQPVSSRSADPKASIKREMDALRASGQPSRPGAMSVSSSGAAPISSADPKARIKAEMDSLRLSDGVSMPGATPVTTTSIAASAAERPSDSKERIKAEMNALRSGTPAGPGAVSVSAAEAEADSRTSRATRKARARNSSRLVMHKEKAIEAAASLKQAPSDRAAVPGAVSGTLDNIPEMERKKAPPPPPRPAPGRAVDAERAKAEADKLMDYDRHKPKQAPAVGAAAATGATVRAQAESSKSIETAQSSKSMPSADSSKSMGLEEMARQKKQAEAAHAARSPSQSGGAMDGEEIVSAVVVDEDALEAEYQQRLMGNVVSAEVVDQKEVEARNRRRCICRCCCPLILVAIILSIVIPLTKPDPELITNSPTGSPTPQSEYDYLVDILKPISGDNLFLEGSAQNQAFDWLLNEDPAMLDIKAANESTLIYRYALATFYYSTGGPEWTDDFSFLSNRSVCEWNIQRQGLTCFDNGEPLTLFFNGVNLNGTVPAEVSALSTLTTVSFVNDGSLTGSIPSEIGLMTGLTLLQFFRSGMSGTVPKSLSSLVNMEALILSSNSFTGTIPDILSDPASAFVTCFFQSNDFEGPLPPLKGQGEMSWFLVNDNNRLNGTLPSSLYSQRDLEWVSFRDTGVGGRLDPRISSLGKMLYFQADRARFSGSLPSSIGNLDLMEQLLLSENALTGTLPTQLGRLDRLKLLNLDGNDFSGTIPTEMAELRDLEIWRMNGNKRLSGSVPASFAQDLDSLQEFNVEGTNLTSGLAESYCELDVLTTVISADCGGDAATIPCECCVECCVDGDGCEFSLTSACQVRSGAFANEDRGTTCACEPDGSSYTCQETCHVCSADGTTCAQTTGYGFELDPETGDDALFTNMFVYTLGGWDDIIEFRNDVTSGAGICEVFVNGQLCASCTEVSCENSFNGFSVDCSNIEADLTFRSCSPDVSEPNSLDVFRYLDVGSVNDTTCQPILPYT